MEKRPRLEYCATLRNSFTAAPDPALCQSTRSRAMAVYAQFDGNPCDGGRTETRACETTQACPLEDGCGDRFRCLSGKCISKSLLCNGDQDCEEDGLDEQDCPAQKFITCEHTVPPPQVELLGNGFDVVSGKSRGSVINTKSFGGQCRPVFSDVHKNLYRLPLSIIQYNFLVTVQKDFSDEMFTSQWHYAKDIVNRERVSGTTTGHRNYDFHVKHDTSQSERIVVLKNEIEVAQFQSNSPKYLPISEEFWKDLAKLPSVYDYSAYRKILEKFGTHYISEGSMGGSLNAIVSINEATEKLIQLVKEVQCSGVKRLFLRKAIEQYLYESHPCHCQPCRNNGLAAMDGDKCKCICKTGTSGLACEQGVEAEGQPGVIHGSWSCWSPWSLCSGGRSSRSRSCSNPSPQNGGHHCTGEPTETTGCEDQEDLQYLKTMEPQCFDQTLPELQKCVTPPNLINGYILSKLYGLYVMKEPLLKKIHIRAQIEFAKSSSLEMCAISPLNGQFVLLTVCKIQAMKCLGKNLEIADDSNCKWPQRSTTDCTRCHMWENCDAQTNQCRCKDSADCLNPGESVCIRVGEDATVAPQTMSECEAGLRRCKGEKTEVVLRERKGFSQCEMSSTSTGQRDQKQLLSPVMPYSVSVTGVEHHGQQTHPEIKERLWCAALAISQPLVRVFSRSARKVGQSTVISPMEMTSSRYKATNTDVPQTYHSAVGHGALGFAGTLGALPPLRVSVRRLADLEDVPGGSGAVFAPIRCRTHAYTSTIKTAPKRNDSVRLQPQIFLMIKTPPPLSFFYLTTLHPLPFTLFSPYTQFTFDN
ncbi:hypothetical protein CCH79_00008913 [Gambusia affinis]|uniref:Complement component C7 n=1 Tax=Gambusia affinis TaxID=33528 RepID=A0A315UW12_GAMAF|nr:hypothetical protein CCH79_00008913 [Gambusia affinis]